MLVYIILKLFDTIGFVKNTEKFSRRRAGGVPFGGERSRMIEWVIDIYLGGVVLLWLLGSLICLFAGDVIMGKVKHRKNGNDSILPSDVVVGQDVNNACELLIGVLMPLLKDAHDTRDFAVAGFCSRLVTDLGALQGMVAEMIREDKIATDKLLVSEDLELAGVFDTVLRGGFGVKKH